MPELEANGVRLFYVEAGSGDETVVLSHSYLVDQHQFAHQVEALAERYRVFAYDHRDHGGSERVASPYDMEAIYADGLGLLEAIGGSPCHWVGLSTGGFVGLRLAFRRPELVRSLVVMDSAGDAEPALRRAKYALMLAVVRWIGFGPVIGEAMKAMFGPAFLGDPARRDERDEWQRRMQAAGRAATVRFGRAIFSRSSVLGELGGIRAPTLVLVGENDRAVVPVRARRTAEAIPGAGFETIPRAGHLSTVEEPGHVSARLLAFFGGL